MHMQLHKQYEICFSENDLIYIKYFKLGIHLKNRGELNVMKLQMYIIYIEAKVF